MLLLPQRRVQAPQVPQVKAVDAQVDVRTEKSRDSGGLSTAGRSAEDTEPGPAAERALAPALSSRLGLGPHSRGHEEAGMSCWELLKAEGNSRPLSTRCPVLGALDQCSCHRAVHGHDGDSVRPLVLCPQGSGPTQALELATSRGE